MCGNWLHSFSTSSCYIWNINTNEDLLLLVSVQTRAPILYDQLQRVQRGSKWNAFKAKYVGLFHNKPYYTKMHINWLRLCPKGLKYVNGDIIKLNLFFLLRNINCRLSGLLLSWRYMSDPCRPYISRFCWKLIIPNWNIFGVILNRSSL